MNRQVVIVTVISFTAVYGLSWLWGQENWAYADQIRFHLPFANLLMERNLNPLGPNLSATTPGVHLIYGAIALATGMAPLQSQSWLIAVLGSIIAAATLGLLTFSYQSLSKNWVWMPLLLLPIFASQYFLLPGAYLVTEGLSYFWLATFIAMTQSNLKPVARQLIASLAIVALVLTRQIYLPVGMAMMLAFVVSPVRWNLALLARQVSFALLPLIAFLPFLFHWKGLVPPEFTKHHSTTLNLSATLQSVALLGLFTFPLLPMLRRAIEAHGQARIAFGVSIALLPMLMLAPADFNVEAGRFGSLIWTLARMDEALTGSSILVFLLFVLGAGVLSWALISEVQPIRLTALGYAVYSLVLATQEYAWQRYSEVFALILVSLVAAWLLPEAPFWQQIFFVVFFAIWLVATFAMRLT